MSSAAVTQRDSGNEAREPPKHRYKRPVFMRVPNPHSAGLPGSWEISYALSARKARAHFLRDVEDVRGKFRERSGTTDHNLNRGWGWATSLKLMVLQPRLACRGLRLRRRDRAGPSEEHTNGRGEQLRRCGGRRCGSGSRHPVGP